MSNETDVKIVSAPNINDRFGKLKLLSKKQSYKAILGGAVLIVISLFFVFGNKKSTVRKKVVALSGPCLLYTSPSPRDATLSRMPSSA